MSVIEYWREITDGEGVIVTHSLKGGSAWSFGSIAMLLFQARASWEGTHVETKQLISWLPRNREKERVLVTSTVTYGLSQAPPVNSP